MIPFLKPFLLLSLSFIFVSTVFAQTKQRVLRPKIERLTNKLRKDDEVHFGYPVGFSGRPETNNKYYKKYLQLKHNATEEELILLTNDTSESMVVYSFYILWQRQYPKLKDIFFQHLNDTTFFWTAGGCTGVLDRINWFMFRLLKPNQTDGSINYLTKDEYNLYCDKFTAADKLFKCN
jgi:hypothetical protein